VTDMPYMPGPTFFPRQPLPRGPSGHPTKEESEASLITGIVADREGHPVKGVQVELINPQNNALLATTTTDHSGFYSLMVNLEEGEYEAKVAYHTVPRVQKVRAAKGQLSQLDFKIQHPSSSRANWIRPGVATLATPQATQLSTPHLVR
jgi:5-hydroxyisourate hydrolase-like protein (transthyretin family)